MPPVRRHETMRQSLRSSGSTNTTSSSAGAREQCVRVVLLNRQEEFVYKEVTTSSEFCLEFVWSQFRWISWHRCKTAPVASGFHSRSCVCTRCIVLCDCAEAGADDRGNEARARNVTVRLRHVVLCFMFTEKSQAAGSFCGDLRTTQSERNRILRPRALSW